MNDPSIGIEGSVDHCIKHIEAVRKAPELLKTLPRGFLKFIEAVLRVPLKTLSQSGDMAEESRKKYTELAACVSQIMEAASKPGPVDVSPELREPFHAAINPLLERYRLLVDTSHAVVSAQDGIDRKRAHGLLLEVFDQQFKKRYQEGFQENYEKDCNELVYDNSETYDAKVLKSRKEIFNQVVQEKYKVFLEKLTVVAESNDSESNDLERTEGKAEDKTKAVINGLMVEYDSFFSQIDEALRACLRVKYGYLNGEKLAYLHDENIQEMLGEFNRAIQSFPVKLNDVQLDLMDELGDAVKVPARLGGDPDGENYGLFYSYYSHFFSLATSVKRDQYLKEESDEAYRVKKHLKEPGIIKKFMQDYLEIKDTLMSIVQHTPVWYKLFGWVCAMISCLLPNFKGIKQSREAFVAGKVDTFYRDVSEDTSINNGNKKRVFISRLNGSLLGTARPVSRRAISPAVEEVANPLFENRFFGKGRTKSSVKIEAALTAAAAA